VCVCVGVCVGVCVCVSCVGEESIGWSFLHFQSIHLSDFPRHHPTPNQNTTEQLALGTLLFHALSSLQHRTSTHGGGGMLMGLYSWELWRSMLWYSPLFVTSNMVLWLRALKLCSPAFLSVGMNLNYFVTVLFGVLIVGKWPTKGETMGGLFILLSIVSGFAETVVHGSDEADRMARRKKGGRRAVEGGKDGVWPVAQPAAAPAAAVEEEGLVGAGGKQEGGRAGTEAGEQEEDETARLIHKHKPGANHLDFESLVEGDGVGIHPFT
jgi:hypothetical protein